MIGHLENKRRLIIIQRGRLDLYGVEVMITEREICRVNSDELLKLSVSGIWKYI